jgi:hypothetical protein
MTLYEPAALCKIVLRRTDIADAHEASGTTTDKKSRQYTSRR